ncbi:MAG: DNA-directed RNA polymerase subunit beta [Dehalococcoidia bacterium]|nr:DNA-directed RNA polymerase subunit beta [Dehalococcoidia bacterium]
MTQTLPASKTVAPGNGATSQWRVTTPNGVKRRWYGQAPEVLALPNLIEVQLRSFERFQKDGMQDVFAEISPIQDFTKKNLSLELTVPEDPFGEPKYTQEQCRDRDMTYDAPLYVDARLHNLQTGEIKESRIFMGDFPVMTERGTFIINGAERVVVSQLVRSPGVYFTATEDANSGRQLYGAKLIPSRGAWLEFETSNRNLITVKIDRRRKIPVTTLLRASHPEIGTDEALFRLFAHVDTDPDHPFVASTIGESTRRDPARSHEEGLMELYRRLRPGDPATAENARNLVHSLLFDPRRYDLGQVGRYKLNRRLRISSELRERTMTPEDLVKIAEELIALNNDPQSTPDDIDHLGNRRIRPVGELIQNQFRVGLSRMERVIKERMTIQDPASATPAGLVNIRPVAAAMKEFFGGSQLSQFMDQINPLSEITHKRRLSALGPGGLSRERAGFEVRDVHHSHYGRICPIETPEGPNIGLIGYLASFGRINPYGFIETPYRRVARAVQVTAETDPTTLVGRVLGAESRPQLPAPAEGDGELVELSGGDALTKNHAAALVAAAAADKSFELAVSPYVTDEIVYLPADEEESYMLAQANAMLDEHGQFVDARVAVRYRGEFQSVTRQRVDLMDVSPKQIVSVGTSLIPFLEHDDANRALMGANMQRQAVPLVQPAAPLVATGVESQVARDSGQVVISQHNGEVVRVTSNDIIVLDEAGEERAYPLQKFVRSNQGTTINQRPTVGRGDRVVESQVLADSSATDQGELALGQNLLCAFMFWEGGNYEDAILISERLVQEDKFTSIHIEKYELEARDTKLGPEEITRDIPNVGDDALKDLDEDGIVYVGAEVGQGDILVGKITPKGEMELTAEERLLRAIFGEKAREVKDTSLRVPTGEQGKIVDVKKFSREAGDELPPGVNEMVRVSVAIKRKLSQGDKMAGRHGNKGVIAQVLPVEDMPYLEDGRPVDIILSPLGGPSRMNIGQVLETHLGWAAESLGMKVASPVFDSASEELIKAELERAGLPASGKVELYDGRSGEQFHQDVCVGYIYMMKLDHLVEDKIHARSTGPYSLITQQPLGGKAQMGGQRFGEMEVWALEAYGASYTLQELLTVKSDDVVGRVKTYEAIVKGELSLEPGVPESFKVLVKELQSLGLNVDILNENNEQIQFVDDSGVDMLPELGINLEGLEDRE